VLLLLYGSGSALQQAKKSSKKSRKARGNVKAVVIRAFGVAAWTGAGTRLCGTVGAGEGIIVGLVNFVIGKGTHVCSE
jgi:hypothetical protein